MSDRDFPNKNDDPEYAADKIISSAEMVKSTISFPSDYYPYTTHILIRSYVGDIGQRPIVGHSSIFSPDIRIYDYRHQQILANQMQTGHQYLIEVRVTNAGGRMSPAVVVELYLGNPSVGQSWQFVWTCKNIGTNTIPICGRYWATAGFYFVPSDSDIGHRCLFARAFSLSTGDYPADWQRLDPISDRHVAQWNIDQIVQRTRYVFYLIDAMFDKRKGTLKEYEITLKVNDKNIKELDLPILQKYNLLTKPINTKTFALSHLGPLPTSIESEEFRPEYPNMAFLEIKHAEKPVGHFEEGMINFSSETGADRMQITIPDLGLKPGEAIPMELEAKDKKTGEIIGGIGLIITA
jgi:hypothetical protein